MKILLRLSAVILVALVGAALILPVTWIITLVALAGAYKLGELGAAGKLKVGEDGLSGDSDASMSDEEDKSDEEESVSDNEVEKEKPGKESKGAVKREKESKKSKPKEKKNVKDDDWEWPVYDKVSGRAGTKRMLRVKTNGKSDTAPFDVNYEVKGERWPDEVTVTFRSQPLIEVAKKCMKYNHLDQLIVEEPEINGRELFLALDSFTDSYKDEEDTSEVKHELKHLIRFLETEYKDTKVRLNRMKRENTVNWDLLWAFLHNDVRVYYTCSMTDQLLEGIVWHSYYERQMQGSQSFCVQIQCRNYNSKTYVRSLVDIDIEMFRGQNSFRSIGICPLDLLENSEVEELEAKFLKNGRSFYDIVKRGNYYMQYEGPRLEMVRARDGAWRLEKQKADGRVMVDLQSFARMNPGYPLKPNAQPWASSNLHSVTLTETPSDDELRLAPAVVYGFSFTNKKWGGFNVTGCSKINFDDQAFDRNLVLLDAERKQMLLHLVREYVQNPANDADHCVQKVDPIFNKGEGCIFLCYGPPGTGKTLTAESIAEKLQRPLWSINVFELGKTPEELEINLLNILGVASEWRAILLLDEADIYMEKRTSSGDPSRAAMTAILLRQLEYYSGVLFLTTNRVASFDDAFCSRISMFLRYHCLEGDQHKAVWSNLFARAGITNPDLTPFTEMQFNGREIRNSIQIAQKWAKSSGVELTTGHVLKVVKMLGAFREDLKGAMDDERSDERPFTPAFAKVCSMQVRDPAFNGNFRTSHMHSNRRLQPRHRYKRNALCAGEQ